MHILSKSTFIRGNQCLKSLFLNEYYKEFKSKISDSQEAVFEQGQKVGILAQLLFPNGIDVNRGNLNSEESAKKTQEEIREGNTIIYEASFLFNEVLVALDILVADSDGWKAFEVKSSTEIKKTHILDAALQYYIIKNSGIDLKDIYIVYINKQYKKKEEFEIDEFFIKKSILKEVEELLHLIPTKIKEFKAVLQQNEIPNIDIGKQCHDPYPCDFIDYCWKKIPKYSVFDIANLSSTKKFELYKKGIIELKDVPKNFPLNKKQWQQINCELEQKEIIEIPKIKKFISELVYPLYFLDFETFQLAIPQFINSKPFQQIPFQYSLHLINSKEEKLIHTEFIAEVNNTDPRILFIEKLITDCGQNGNILVYNIAFERARLFELSNDFPQFTQAIQGIIDRLKDLMIPFKERWYYTPKMKGSYSIKVVLPSLIPEFSYDNLEIKDGSVASSIYSSMVQGLFNGNKENSIKALLEYCKLDTLAMVKIFDKLDCI